MYILQLHIAKLPNQMFLYLCNRDFSVFTALLSVTTLNYLLSLLSLVMFYLYFTHSDGCTENKVFISINMLLCIAASVLSVLPQIQVTCGTHLKTRK